MTTPNQAPGAAPDPSARAAGVAPRNETQRALLEIVHALATGIGPRPSAGEGERLAAAYMISRLRRAGYEVDLEPFSGLTTWNWTYGLLYGALALAGVLGRRLPWLAALLGASGFAAYLAETLGFETVARLPGLPRGRSQNVVARLPLPEGGAAAPPRVVITAHLDSARAAWPFHPRLVGRFRASFVACTLVMAVIAAGGLLRLALPAGSPTRRRLDRGLAGAAATLLLPLAALLHREAGMPVVPGANDNASGAAVVLAAAARLAERLRDRVDRTAEVWIVFTGCAESGLGGMHRFLEDYGADFDRENTIFLNVDSVGAGLLTLVNQEGLLWPLLADSVLINTATQIAVRRRLHFQTRGFHTLPTDAQVPLSRGYRTLSLMALDERGHVPHWHWPTDTPDAIDPATVEATFDLLWRLVRRLATAPGR